MTLINNAENDKEMKQRFVKAMSIAFEYADIDSKLRLAGTCCEMSDALEEKTWALVADCDNVHDAFMLGSAVLVGYWVDDTLVTLDMFRYACHCGLYELVTTVVDLGCDPDFALMCACEVGDIELIDIAISLGADDLELGLQTAFLAGEYEAAVHMGELGASDFYEAAYQADFRVPRGVGQYMLSRAIEDAKFTSCHPADGFGDMWLHICGRGAESTGCVN